MEGTGEEHNIWAALKTNGANPECPSCGQTSWFRNPNPVVFRETRPAAIDDVGVPRGGELFGGVPAYALICQRCGFIRLHATQALLGDTDASG